MVPARILKPKGFHLFVISTVLGIWLSGCAAQRMGDLSKRINAYWDGLRWRAPGAIAMYVQEDHRSEYLSEVTKRLDQLRIVDYSVMNLNVGSDDKSAMAVINYSYYQLNENDLRNAQELQQWQYSKRDGWLLKTRK